MQLSPQSNSRTFLSPQQVSYSFSISMTRFQATIILFSLLYIFLFERFMKMKAYNICCFVSGLLYILYYSLFLHIITCTIFFLFLYGIPLYRSAIFCKGYQKAILDRKDTQAVYFEWGDSKGTSQLQRALHQFSSKASCPYVQRNSNLYLKNIGEK